MPHEIRHALEDWAGILFAIGVALLLLATLKAQVARAAEFPRRRRRHVAVRRPTASLDPPPLSPPTSESRSQASSRACRVVQRFANTGGEFSEAVYVLPLPDDAAVDRLTMKVGDRVVEGEIHEREQAEHVYGAARAAGQHASLVRQNTPNLFTTAVANIAPGEAIEITIEYLQTARFDNGEFSLRVPMTIHRALRRRHAGGARRL